MFRQLYDKLLTWASHRHAEKYLAGVTFAESSFFPLPVEIMLAPMTFAQPKKWLRFATLATIFSVLGGVFGYLIGAFGFELVQPLIEKVGYTEKWDQVKALFDQYGIWIVFIAGFSPLPYKLFTIGAGLFSLNIVGFIVASIIGRGARFFLVSFIFGKFGPTMAPTINKYIEWIGWAAIALLGAVFAWQYWFIGQV